MSDRLKGFPGGPGHALERDLSDGREAWFCFGVASRRGADDGALRGVWDQLEDGLQVARPVSGRRHGRAAGPFPGAAASRSGAGARGCRRDCGAAPRAPVLGSAEASRGSDAGASGDRVACGEHDGGASALGGSCAAASPSAPFAVSGASVPGGDGSERCLVHRLQGMVLHGRPSCAGRGAIR